MKFKSISSDLLVTIVTLVAAFAAVTAAMASQQPGPGFERYDQAYPEPYAYPLAQNVARVSVASDATQANNRSYAASISADGRYVVFASHASNLAAVDTNGMLDIFVHDRQTGETSRVSVSSDGSQANGDSYAPSISADGRYVAFETWASNLVSGDTNETDDIFVHDRQTGETTRISLALDGSQADSYSYKAYISADGRYVAFYSNATNLVAGDTNGLEDVFVHNRQSGETIRVSVASDGAQANNHSSLASISADGRYVAFESWASNLVADDTNEASDIFIHDIQTDETSRISLASDGTQANGESSAPSISADGRFVTFSSRASNLTLGDTNGYSDIFIYDLQTGSTSRILNQANNPSYSPSISVDGRFVAFQSWASNLVTGDTNGYPDIFVHDILTGITSRIPNIPPDFQPNIQSYAPSISANGRAVAFESYASNLVTEDTNGISDVFVYENLGKLAPADGATTMPLLLSLSWQASPSAASYEYCYSSVPGPCTKWNSVGTDTSVTLSGLAPGYTYYWQARAVNPGGVIEADAATWWSFTTTTTPPNNWPPYTPPGSATFGDTPATHWAWDWIERLYSAGITGGCGSGSYCPEEPVTRAQIAVFLLRGVHGSGYTPPAATGAIFADVPATHWAANWIEQFYADGITGGCGGGGYCPEQPVTRAQMAVFLLRARYGSSYSPPAVDGSTGFGDVAADYWAASWIKQLAAEGITGGCGNGNYCPEEPVTRAQMAVFLVRAFGLP